MNTDITSFERKALIILILYNIFPVAWLCFGFVSFIYEIHELEQAGWLPGMELCRLVDFEHWGGSAV